LSGDVAEFEVVVLEVAAQDLDCPGFVHGSGNARR
jgi:hypothetical protein